MKGKDVTSAVIGASFFAIPYLALSIPILPSVLIGATAFAAGELVLPEEKRTLKKFNNKLYQKIELAKKQNAHILDMIPKIEDDNIRMKLHSINDCVSKIINTIEKSPKKVSNIKNFFEYYLPVTIKIIDRYDEIENQKLSDKKTKDFMKSTNEMILEIENAFKGMLSSLYESDMIDIDIEKKVFDSMIQSDGILSKEIIKEDKDGK